MNDPGRLRELRKDRRVGFAHRRACTGPMGGLPSRGFIARIMLRAGSGRVERGAALHLARQTRPPPTLKADTATIQPISISAQPSVKMLNTVKHVECRTREYPRPKSRVKPLQGSPGARLDTRPDPCPVCRYFLTSSFVRSSWVWEAQTRAKYSRVGKFGIGEQAHGFLI